MVFVFVGVILDYIMILFIILVFDSMGSMVFYIVVGSIIFGFIFR